MTDPIPAEAVQGEPAELRGLPVEVRQLVHAVDRMRDQWADSDAARRQELWRGVHAASDAVWNRQEAPAPSAPEQSRDDMIVAAAKALWEREFETYEECSHSWSEMPRIAAVAVDAAGLAEPAPTRWAYGQAVKALEKHRQRADRAEQALARVREALAGPEQQAETPLTVRTWAAREPWSPEMIADVTGVSEHVIRARYGDTIEVERTINGIRLPAGGPNAEIDEARRIIAASGVLDRPVAQRHTGGGNA